MVDSVRFQQWDGWVAVLVEWEFFGNFQAIMLLAQAVPHPRPSCFTARELRIACVARRLPREGRKLELIDRLMQLKLRVCNELPQLEGAGPGFRLGVGCKLNVAVWPPLRLPSGWVT